MEDNTAVEKRDAIDSWHKQRGWRGIGYHRVIDRDGTLVAGRDYSQVGAHVAGHNTYSIGVCLLGGHGSSSDDAFEEHFTVAQEKTLVTVLRTLKSKYPNAVIRGHNEVAAKACPGFNVAAWWEQFK